MKLAVQEHLIPGGTVLDKWNSVRALGYEGIELRGAGDAEFVGRMPHLVEVVRQGANISSICATLPGVFLGSIDAGARRDAVTRIKLLLSAAAALGAAGVVAPASYGIHPIPRAGWPRSPEEDDEILADGYGELGLHAAAEAVEIWIEPLNRYEDHMVNRLEQGAALCQRIGLASVGIIADVFHMGIEEANVPAAIVANSRWIRHVHGADNTRAEPGAGQTDFVAIKRALNHIGYSRFIALECRPTGEPLAALRRAAATLA